MFLVSIALFHMVIGQHGESNWRGTCHAKSSRGVLKNFTLITETECAADHRVSTAALSEILRFCTRGALTGYNGRTMKRILIVDDEEMIVRTVKAYLDREGFKTYTAYDGEEALRAFEDKGPDLIVLDLMLPKVSGIEVTRLIRAKSAVPIIMLTAKAAEADRVVGLELGADDYVVKPFSPRELVARIRAVLRRFEGEGAEVERIVVGGIEIDLKTRELKVDGNEIELTPTEFDLLSYLARHPGQVFTRLQLLREVQGYTYDSFARTIDTHVKNLRRKIEADPKVPTHILTVHGVGYRFARET